MDNTRSRQQQQIVQMQKRKVKQRQRGLIAFVEQSARRHTLAIVQRVVEDGTVTTYCPGNGGWSSTSYTDEGASSKYYYTCPYCQEEHTELSGYQVTAWCKLCDWTHNFWMCKSCIGQRYRVTVSDYRTTACTVRLGSVCLQQHTGTHIYCKEHEIECESGYSWYTQFLEIERLSFGDH